MGSRAAGHHSGGHRLPAAGPVFDNCLFSLRLTAGLCLQLFRLITVMDSDNFPECCHAIYIANAGAAFSAIWKLLAPFVDKGTRDKVHVLGGVKASQVSGCMYGLGHTTASTSIPMALMLWLNG
jgi:hypothetical protein